ncbi:MAG TPA: hypothetical protein VFF39_16010 [Verrucomicrobiae bacterium]|nr:hypothetical protein [Verrucomicrobiae bacterium]
MFILFSNWLRVDAFSLGASQKKDQQADERVENGKGVLVAGEQIGACMRGQHRQIAARAD